MRAPLYFIVGFGFLTVLAYSWAPEATPPLPASSIGTGNYASSNASRTPASVPSASLAEIHRLSDFYKSATTREQKFTVSESLAIALAEHFTNFGADAELAREAVKHPEPIVQVVGLRMLSALPTSALNLSALENGLRNSPDPALLEASLKELRRYLGSSLEADAQGIVETLVSNGLASRLVSAFINEHSYQEFREVLGGLEPGAEARAVLSAALSQYESARQIH